ncbi:MAG: hypothetical protein CVU46_15650 [Chloroflexi bacterium HGW-Chloroflexi-8]|nr:MAG: hypothetical protein CVU46_15650 [Chloroflexi bacterium HGW-Chloroflexi-8]
MRIHPIVYGLLVLIVFFGIILGFQSAGIWSISGKVDASGKAIQPSAADVETIKGWMTLEQISTTYNVPLPELLNQFGLPLDTLSSTAIKDLENDLFSSEVLKTWLVSRSLPITSVPTSPMVTPPIDIVSPTPESNNIVIPESTEHVAPEKTVTGSTTFQDILDWGVTIETIQSVIKEDMPAPSIVIKDYITGKGLAFSEVKNLLQVEVDQVK